VPLEGMKQRKSGVKLIPGRREGRGKVSLRFDFICSYPALIGLVIN